MQWLSFLKLNKFRGLEVPVTEIYLKLEFIELCEETGVETRSTWFLELKTLRFF